MSLTRRELLARLARTAFSGSLVSGAGALGYAHYLEPSWLDLTRLNIALPRLPDAFAGFTIAQLSDLHFGRWIKPADIAPAVDAALALRPDAIVITGDIVSTINNGETDMIVETLSRLEAPEGVFATLGNHDWWVGGVEVAAALRRAGVQVLTNEHIRWQRGGQSLVLAGIDDVWCNRHDLTRALAGLTAADTTLLLCHEPDYADEVARTGRVALQLSGHSHGGQVRVPFYGGLHFPPWARKYPEGLRQLGDLTLYTNRGLGFSGLPVRFACRPEVTHFSLRPGPCAQSV